MNDFKSALTFKNYVANEVIFKSNFNFSGREDVEIKFDINSSNSVEGNNFILTLGVIVFPEAEINDYPFTMKVEVSGLFKVDSNISDDTKRDFIERNAIAILFPYVRAMLSLYSSNSNVGTIVLPPINVVKYLENKKNKYKK